MQLTKELSREELNHSIGRFLEWLEMYGENSYDLMDFYGSQVGNFTKRVFYKNKIIGAPMALLALFQETFIPAMLKLYAKPHRESIGDSHYALGFLNLYEITGDKRYLDYAKHFLEELMSSYSKGYSGYCWGYTYGWQTSDGRWPPRTPLITVTPYSFWAFKRHYELTEDLQSLEIARSASRFALHDLRKLELPNKTFCYSYSPIDNRYIINANAYRAAMLIDAYEMFNEKVYKEEADISLEFILSYQQPDGKWYYEAIGERDKFVDNFHTCFVLKNLNKYYEVTGNDAVKASILKGYKYYRDHLFRSDNTPLHFSVQKYNKLRKYEMYDYAEGISLGCQLSETVDGALDFAKQLTGDLIKRFQLKDGHFITRVTSFGTRNKVPYHRWPQSQLFYALTNLLKKIG